MVSISKAHGPRTPARRLSRLLSIFSRPANHPRTASRFIQGVRSTSRTGEVSVAIQNEDTTEDAVVVTSLDKIPFCCHADLLLMRREQLLTVASILNGRLPIALQIDTDRPDSYIRNSIEFTVGLRNNPPDAPTKPATPSRNFVPSSPISPLARHSRSQNSQLIAGPSPLADVPEEEGTEEYPAPTLRQRCKGPPPKRRKFVQEPDSPTPPHAKPRLSMIRCLGSPPTRLVTRSQSTRTTRPEQPPPDRILRSQSQRVNFKSSAIVTPSPSLASLHTPKRRVRSLQRQPSSDVGSTSPLHILAESPAPDSPPSTRVTRHGRRRDSSIEREAGMVIGLQNMNIPTVGSG